MILGQLATLDTGQETVIIIITGDAMKTGEAVAVVVLSTAVAVDIHSTDEELCR